MRAVPLVASLGILVAGCYKQVVYEPTTPGPEPSWVQGPPGGAMDPGYGYGTGGSAADSSGYGAPGVTSYDSGHGAGYGVSTGGSAQVDAALTSQVTDAEIESTLSAHGEWVWSEEHGWIWRPHDTVVGADFTPYESCGSWVYTELGWTFQSCPEWDWGWLAFHYGQWTYYDDSWCWVAGYDYSPGWVDWSYGDGYVGWRPTEPRPARRGRFRDHRDGRGPGTVATGPRRPRFRDHRDGQPGDARSAKRRWSFVAQADLGRPDIRRHVVKSQNLAGAMTPVAQPPVRSIPQTTAAALMQPRIGKRAHAVGGRPATPVRPASPAWQQGRPAAPSWQQGRPATPGYSSSRPTYTPSRPATPSWQQPSRPTYTPSRPAAPSWQQPSRPTFTPSRPSYSPPSRPSYSPPSRPSYSPPSRSESPSRSSSSSSSSSSGSRSSSSSFGGSRGKR